MKFDTVLSSLCSNHLVLIPYWILAERRPILQKVEVALGLDGFRGEDVGCAVYPILHAHPVDGADKDVD